ncbi:MAG: CcdB family protein [Caulobacterales bacterium]|nr:CcdB family protein [Caulobacterales bacterium]
MFRRHLARLAGDAAVRRRPQSEGRGSAARPFFVSLQSHHLDGFDTVVIAPMIEAAARIPTRVDVSVEFEGRPLIVAVSELTSTARAGHLRVIGDLKPHEDDIRRALERLFSGF